MLPPRSDRGTNESLGCRDTAEKTGGTQAIIRGLIRQWRVHDDRPHPLELRLTEVDGRLAAAHSFVVQASDVPASGEYARWEGVLPVHASLLRGPLNVELGPAPRGLVPCGIPLLSNCINLGRISEVAAEK